jgi:glycine zipper 2TM protein
MRIHLLAAGVAVAALIPTFALAQQSCEQRRSSQAVATIAGAGIGALLGSAVAGHGDRTTGAIVGGVGGAVVGNQLSKPDASCAHAYGYYDNSGAWHASNVSQQYARGYYDREGAWVDGAPNGHYSNDGRWIRTSDTPSAAGYYDNRGRWVPASASGYYAADGRWVSGAASGYYDSRGRWIAGPATGRYDERGRWIPGQASRTADSQPGYYDQGKWRPGPVSGYYDTNGRWIQTESQGARYGHRGGPSDISGRQIWLDERIHRGLNDGSLTRREGDRALSTLASIGRQERGLRNPGGNLRPRDERMIQARLDDLTESVRIMGRGPVRQY